MVLLVDRKSDRGSKRAKRNAKERRNKRYLDDYDWGKTTVLVMETFFEPEFVLLIKEHDKETRGKAQQRGVKPS